MNFLPVIALYLSLIGQSVPPPTAPKIIESPLTAQSTENPLTEDKNIDVRHYHIKIEVALDSQYVQASVDCRFTSLVDKLTEINLDLAKGFKVYKVDGAKSYMHKDNKLTIQLSTPQLKDQTSSVTVYYKGKPPKATDGQVTKGLIYEKHGKDKASKNEPVIVNLSTPFLAHYWYPCKDGPSDKADSVAVDITVKDTIISGYNVIGVSNGMLRDSVIANGKRTYKWRHGYPIVPFYVLCAVSNYKRYIQPFEDNFGNKYPLEFFVFEEHSKKAEVTFRRMPDIMNVLSATFGPYPFKNEKYGMTQLGFYSGIEKQTNSIVNNMAPTEMATTVHEAAHQWFACDVTAAPWNHAWLNEGMATYSEAIWQDNKYGFDKYKENIKTNEWYNDGTLYLKDATHPFQVFKPIVYAKGAYVVHMLRHVMSDKYFFAMLKKYANHEDFKFKTVTTEDFQSFCEKMCGEDLEYFFKEWVYGENYPIYDYAWSHDPEKKELHVTINQKTWQTTPSFFIMPLDIQLINSKGEKRLEQVMNDLVSQKFVIENVVEAPAEVNLDHDDWVLKQVRFKRQILNTKTPLTLKDIDGGKLGRKVKVVLGSEKKQEVTVELVNDKNEVKAMEKLEVKSMDQTLDLQFEDDKVEDGAYKLRITGKSDVYFVTLKIL